LFLSRLRFTVPGAILIGAGAEGARDTECYQLKLLTLFTVLKLQWRPKLQHIFSVGAGPSFSFQSLLVAERAKL